MFCVWGPIFDDLISAPLTLRHPGLELLQQPIASFLAAIRQDEHGAKTRTPTIGVRSTASLWDVVQKLAATKVHRLFVADPPLFKPEAVISLTDVLRHLLPEATATATAGGASQHK